MTVVPIRNIPTATAKVVEANQKSIDALKLNSGEWRVLGVPGLFIRCRAQTKTFRVERRMDGKIVKKTLGALPMKQAKTAAMAAWGRMKPKAENGEFTFGQAVEDYMEAKGPKLSESFRRMMTYNVDRYLADWKNRSMAVIGADLQGVRTLHQKITDQYGRATANQVAQLVSAVFNWARKANPTLPGNPTIVVERHKIKPRDWAYSPDELKGWWDFQEEKDGNLIRKGVSALGPIKRMWWLTALLTGGRKGSIEALRWADVDLDRKTIHFRIAKADRPYIIPMADKLTQLLVAYRTSGEVPPAGWVFPSPVVEGAHVTDVRNGKQGVGSAHRLRHTFRTTLAELGASPDQARMLMGHSMAGDVSRNYITAPLVLESLRPIANAVATKYAEILGW